MTGGIQLKKFNKKKNPSSEKYFLIDDLTLDHDSDLPEEFFDNDVKKEIAAEDLKESLPVEEIHKTSFDYNTNFDESIDIEEITDFVPPVQSQNHIKQDSIKDKSKKSKKTANKITESKDDSDFLGSLEKLSANEIPKITKNSRKHKTSSFPTLIRTAILLICSGVFVYSATQIVFSYADSLKNNQIQSDIQSQFYKKSELSVTKASLKNARTLTLTEMLGADSDGITFVPPELLSEYQELTKNLKDTLSSGKFPDGYAWVKIPGTRVDHLVVLGNDNDYYLNHAEDRSYNEAGAVFADYKTNKDYLSNPHIVLYGHNRSNGSMFGTIPNFFRSADRWDLFSKAEIQVVTGDTLYIYKPFSAYITSRGHYINYNFPSDSDWVEFQENALNDSIHSKWTTGYRSYIKPSARFLTFSTCTNNFVDVNERYVLHCVLVDIIKEPN